MPTGLVGGENTGSSAAEGGREGGREGRERGREGGSYKMEREGLKYIRSRARRERELRCMHKEGRGRTEWRRYNVPVHIRRRCMWSTYR